jgi:hypothetical protein
MHGSFDALEAQTRQLVSDCQSLEQLHVEVMGEFGIQIADVRAHRDAGLPLEFEVN